jgi:general secretion pathway protein M
MSAVDNLRQRFETSPLGQRWQALPPRDRLAVGLLGGFLALVAFYLLVWQPAQRQAVQARAYYEQQRELNAYLHARAPAARGLGDGEALPRIEAARLQGFVASSAVEQGLTVERLDSEGQGAVLVSLQPAPFGQLLEWFQALEAQGVRIDEAGLDRAEQGRVAARFTLRVAE